jgi:hypothetical protein
MFYVFGINGPMYHGGPERLSQIAPVPRAAPPGIEHAGRRHRHRFQHPVAATVHRDHAAPRAAQSAVSAYASAAQGPKEERRPLSLVRDVMTRGALTVSPRSMVNDAWQTLALHRVSQAPVLNDAQQVIGLLLRADMAPLDLLPTPVRCATPLPWRAARCLR